MSFCFSELTINEPILTTLNTLNHTRPTHIQSVSIPVIFQGRDFFGQAGNGSGKTAAYILPVLQMLGQSREYSNVNAVHALILTPTPELAREVNEMVRIYSHNMNIRHCAINGFDPESKRISQLKKGTRIVVGTPEQVLAMVKGNQICPGNVRFCILDDADIMVSMGLSDSIRELIMAMPVTIQSLIFAASATQDLIKLAEVIQVKPIKEYTGNSRFHSRATGKVQLHNDPSEDNKPQLAIDNISRTERPDHHPKSTLRTFSRAGKHHNPGLPGKDREIKQYRIQGDQTSFSRNQQSAGAMTFQYSGKRKMANCRSAG